MRVARNSKTGAIRTKGLEELSATLVRMWTFNDSKAMTKAVTRSISKGVTIVRRAYVEAAPNGPPKNSKSYPRHLKMKKAVRRRVRRPQKRKPADAKVGFNVNIKKNAPKRAYHAHLPSLGTVQRWKHVRDKSGKVIAKGRSGGGQWVGRVKPSSRIGNMVKKSYGPAIKAIHAEYGKYIRTIMPFIGGK